MEITIEKIYQKCIMLIPDKEMRYFSGEGYEGYNSRPDMERFIVGESMCELWNIVKYQNNSINITRSSLYRRSAFTEITGQGSKPVDVKPKNCISRGITYKVLPRKTGGFRVIIVTGQKKKCRDLTLTAGNTQHQSELHKYLAGIHYGFSDFHSLYVSKYYQHRLPATFYYSDSIQKACGKLWGLGRITNKQFYTIWTSEGGPHLIRYVPHSQITLACQNVKQYGRIFRGTYDFGTVRDYFNMKYDFNYIKYRRRKLDLKLNYRELHDNLVRQRYGGRNRRRNWVAKDFQIHDHFTPLIEEMVSDNRFKLIKTKERLTEESLIMQHCVASYSSRINNGECVIFHVDTKQELGLTLQVNRIYNGFKAIQCLGYENECEWSPELKVEIEKKVDKVNQGILEEQNRMVTA